MIICLFHSKNGWVHCERLFSIVLYYWYGLWHMLCKVKCMIHFDLRYADNHFDWLILVYTMILSLWQAFQGLTPNGSFVYLKCWNLENINVLKTPEYFGVEKNLSIFVSLWTMVLFAWHLIKLRLFAIDFWQRLKDILSLLYNFFWLWWLYSPLLLWSSDTNWLVSYERPR